MKIRFFFMHTPLLLISLNTIINEAKNWIRSSNQKIIKELEGNYYLLKHGSIKTYLPEGFKQCFIEQYSVILNASLIEKEVCNEMKRLQGMSAMKGSFFLFFDAYTLATYSFNTFPYMDFTRSNTNMLLAIIKSHINETRLTTNFTFKKFTAAFKKKKEFTMFRSIFRIDNFAKDIKIFSNFYFITSNKKTFKIN